MATRSLTVFLQEFICFAMCALCLQEDLSSYLTETIKLLANGGAHLNVIAKRYILLHGFIFQSFALNSVTEKMVSVLP